MVSLLQSHPSYQFLRVLTFRVCHLVLLALNYHLVVVELAGHYKGYGGGREAAFMLWSHYVREARGNDPRVWMGDHVSAGC